MFHNSEENVGNYSSEETDKANCATCSTCAPLLKQKDMSVGVGFDAEDLNRYSPRDRVVCAAIILWFVVPLFWSWRFADHGVLLVLSTASTVFLILAAFNFYLDGTRYTWKMWTDVVAVVILATIHLIRAILHPTQILMPLIFALGFFGLWVLNGLQITWSEGLARVGVDWILSFISYRWCAVLACLSVALEESQATLTWGQMAYLTALYYTHSLLMWYRAKSLKTESDKGVHNCLTWPRNLYWLLETAAVVTLTCTWLGRFEIGHQQAAAPTLTH